MKKFMILLLAITIIMPMHLCSAQETTAIEIFYENGLLKGDGESLAPDRYMTCGEFAMVALRLYSKDHETAETYFDNWKDYVLYNSAFICYNDDYLNLRNNFDEPITPEFAQDILLGMLRPTSKDGSHISYLYWAGTGKSGFIMFDGLAKLGYDMSVIPDSEYLTRQQGCRMLYELLYLKFPDIGDYIPTIYIEQYTLNGREVLYKINPGDASVDMLVDMLGK